MYERNSGNPNVTTERRLLSGVGDSPPIRAAIPGARLASRRDLLRGALLIGGAATLAGYSRLARGGYTVNLGQAPSYLGYLNPTAVQNTFYSLVAEFSPRAIPAANLNTQEASILASRYPSDLSAYFPAGSAAKAKYQYTREFLPCPPVLGCLGGLDSTLTEIYLDFRLFGGVPAGGLYAPLSVPAATLATSLYYGGLILGAYGAGFAAGTYLVGWMQKYDTTSWDQIVTLTGSVANAVSWMGSSMQSLASGAYNYGNNLFGKDAWNYNVQFFNLPPTTLGISGGYGFGDSFGWGVFDDISALDIDESGVGCISPDGC